MSRLVLSLILLLLAIAGRSQDIQLSKLHDRIIIPSGPLVRYYSYTFRFDSSVVGFLTFNDKLLEKQRDNSFYFYPTKDGELKVYEVTNNDTFLLKKARLHFFDPNFSVNIAGVFVGDTIEKKELFNGSVGVNVLNNDIEINFPIKEVTLSYFERCKLQTVKLQSGTIPNEVARKIQQSTTEILILKVKFSTEDRDISLTKVFYLK